MFMLYFESIRAGRCRERRYADHIFIQIYFRVHDFVVKFSQFFFASGGKGALTPPLTKIPRTFLLCTTTGRVVEFCARCGLVISNSSDLSAGEE